MHNLIITEKPSVARTISKVLGVTARRDGYLEGGGYLISWCVGHLVELAPPGAYDPRLERWDRADLPILPDPGGFQEPKIFNRIRFAVQSSPLPGACRLVGRYQRDPAFFVPARRHSQRGPGHDPHPGHDSGAGNGDCGLPTRTFLYSAFTDGGLYGI